MLDRGSLNADTSCLRMLSRLAANLCGKLVDASSQALDAGKQWAKKFLKGERKEKEEHDDIEKADPLEKFASVRANIDLTIIQEYASCVRRSRVSPEEYSVTPWVFECTTTSSPLHGSYNILFPLIFSDGVRWLFKVPSRGYEGLWDDMAARALISEALTMRYLRRKSIPVPEVYSFDASMDNALGCPFILMEHVHGRRLYEGWFGTSSSGERLESFRRRCLQTLAFNMTKLGDLRFPQAGTLAYDSTNAVCSIKPTRVLDFKRMSDNLVDWQSGSEEYDNGDYFREVGPFDSEDGERNHFLSLLEDHEPRATKFGEGIYQLLQLFVEWLPREGSENPFVILHPDLDLQNLLVDDNGAVISLIDWDGVTTVSRSIGCAYPKWLTHDWDPWNYVYHSGQPDQWGRTIQSPQELKRYREMYMDFFQQASLESNDTISSAQDAATVRKSLLIGSLKLAMENSQSTDGIVLKIYDLIAQITGQKTFRAESGSALQFENAYDASSLEADEVRSKTSASERKISSSATSSDTTGSTGETHSSYTQESTAPTESSTRSSIHHSKSHSNPAVDEVVHPTEAVRDAPVTEHATDLASASNSTRQNPLLKKAKGLQMRLRLRMSSKAWSSTSKFGDTKYVHEGPTGLSVRVDSTMFEMVTLQNTTPDSPVQESASIEGARGTGAKKTVSCHGSSNADLGESSSSGSSGKFVLAPAFSTLENPHGLTSDHIANPEPPSGQTIDTTDTKLFPASYRVQKTKITSGVKEEQIRRSSTAPGKSVQTEVAEQAHHKAIEPRRWQRLVKKRESSHITIATGSQTTRNNSSNSKSRTKRATAWLKTVFRNTRPKDDTLSLSASTMPERLPSQSESTTSIPEVPNSTYTPSSSLNHDPQAGQDHPQTTRKSVSNQEMASQSGTSSAAESIPCPPGLQKFDLDKLESIDDDRLFDQRFLPPQVCADLVDGTLDEARMRRLKTGFQVLLNSI